MTAMRGKPVADLQDRRDRDSIQAITAGDEPAFVGLYRRYSAAAYGLARRVTGDATLADEVLQEVFTSVWRRSSSYESSRGTVRSWLLAQIHHRSVDVVRREAAERRRLTDPVQQPVQHDAIDDVVEEAWLSSRRADVAAAVSALSQEQRRVIELCYMDGMTQAQVAKAMDVPLGTVKSRTVGAMKRLRALLGGVEENIR